MLPRLRDRKFTEVNPDNFDTVLKGMKPRLVFSVENMLSEDPEAGQLPVNLRFESLEDFSPEKVANQVEPLKKLMALRQRLSDLRGTLQTNETLDEVLLETMNDKAKMDKLKEEFSREGGSK